MLFGASTFLAKIALFVMPGSTMTTRMPNGATSWASSSLTPSNAHLDATYGAWPIEPNLPTTDVTLTIVPLPRSRMPGSTACRAADGAAQVDVHHVEVHRRRALLHHRVAADAGVVHEHVDVARLVEDLGEPVRHRGVVGDIELDELHLDAGVGRHRQQLPGAVDIANRPVHDVALAGEVDGGRAADAAVRPGDHTDQAHRRMVGRVRH